MSNTTLLDLDKDVHMYFDYVIDVTSEILIEGVFDVVDEAVVGNTNKKVLVGEDASEKYAEADHPLYDIPLDYGSLNVEEWYVATKVMNNLFGDVGDDNQDAEEEDGESDDDDFVVVDDESDPDFGIDVLCNSQILLWLISMLNT